MAKIVTIELIVDEDNDEAIADGLNEVLRPLTVAGDDESCGWLVDYQFKRSYYVPAHIEDSIVNETYEEGDAFK